jgi:hypothetical protein
MLGGMRRDISGLSTRNQINQVDGMFGEEVSQDLALVKELYGPYWELGSS